jgi:hypothetical protein
MINVEPITGPLAAEILALLRNPPSEKQQEENTNVPIGVGISIKGFFDMVCRNEDQSISWEEHKSNIFTDYGRRRWMAGGISTGSIFTSGVAETPRVDRYSLVEGWSTAQTMTAVAPSTDWGAWTKTWSTTMSAPGSNRQIACVGVIPAGAVLGVSYGARLMACYALINPVKTQTTSQTLEISYRLTMQVGV